MKIYNDDIFDIYTNDNFAHHRRTYIYLHLSNDDDGSCDFGFYFYYVDLSRLCPHSKDNQS